MRLNLSSKFNLLMATVFLAVTAAAWLFSVKIISVVNEQWATQFSQRQVQFDKHRTLLPLTREIALARQLAVEPALLEIAKNEDDAEIHQQAIAVLERYRTNFRDQSYFFALAGSGNYYYNNAENAFSGHQKRYQLSPSNPNDQWFYATIKNGKSYQVNLDPDVNLGVTKVWINVLVEDGGKVVGMVGTGIDITAFLRETVDVGQAGVYNIFVDKDMAIQLYRDVSLIDYASVTKEVQARSRVDSLLTDPRDIALLKQVMQRVEKSHYGVETIPVTFKGHQHLLGVAYLPEIGWFDLTLMDTKGLFLVENFFMIPVAVSVMFLLAILAFGYLLNRCVIKPLAALNLATLKIEQGDFELPEHIECDGKDEIGEVTRAFRKMASSLKQYTSNLEIMVMNRTTELEAVTSQLKKSNEELDHLSRTDRLTQTRNRYDLLECLQIEARRSIRAGLPCGVVMVDIDHFKDVNDRYGHAAGDETLKAVTSAISDKLRSEDILGRWGGEEFLILLPGSNLHEAEMAAEKIRRAIETMSFQLDGVSISLTISQGVAVYLPSQFSEIESCVKKADQAMYRAKESGRNKVVVSA